MEEGSVWMSLQCQKVKYHYCEKSGFPAVLDLSMAINCTLQYSDVLVFDLVVPSRDTSLRMM